MISQKTKYAIKALIYLAQQEKGNLSRTADISVQTRIPKKFLEQILLDLKRASMVSSVQGSRGGYFLLRDPKKITLVDIHRLLDGPVAMVPCVSLNFYHPCHDCVEESKCPLNWSLIKVRDKTLAAMKGITIYSLSRYTG